MKRIISMLLMITIILTLSACGLSNVDNTESNKVPSDNIVSQDTQTSNAPASNADWKEGIVFVNGKETKLLSSLIDFLDATDCFILNASCSELNPNEHSRCVIANNSGASFEVSVQNLESETKPVEECTVYQITATNGGTTIFPQGLRVGDKLSEKDAVNLFGTPDNDTVNGNVHYLYYYSYNAIFNGNISFTIEIQDGKIFGLSLSYSK